MPNVKIISMEKTFKVIGMTCNHCVLRVKKALESIEGIEEINVDLNTGIVKIKASRDIPCDEIITAIEEWDYKVADC